MQGPGGMHGEAGHGKTSAGPTPRPFPIYGRRGPTIPCPARVAGAALLVQVSVATQDTTLAQPAAPAQPNPGSGQPAQPAVAQPGVRPRAPGDPGPGAGGCPGRGYGTPNAGSGTGFTRWIGRVAKNLAQPFNLCTL